MHTAHSLLAQFLCAFAFTTAPASAAHTTTHHRRYRVACSLLACACACINSHVAAFRTRTVLAGCWCVCVCVDKLTFFLALGDTIPHHRHLCHVFLGASRTARNGREETTALLYCIHVVRSMRASMYVMCRCGRRAPKSSGDSTRVHIIYRLRHFYHQWNNRLSAPPSTKTGAHNSNLFNQDARCFIAICTAQRKMGALAATIYHGVCMLSGALLFLNLLIVLCDLNGLSMLT